MKAIEQVILSYQKYWEFYNTKLHYEVAGDFWWGTVLPKLWSSIDVRYLKDKAGSTVWSQVTVAIPFARTGSTWQCIPISKS